MSDMIKRDDVLAIIEGRFSGTMLGDILKQDINALPEAETQTGGRQCRIDRWLQPVHVHIDTEEILEKIREEYELTDDIVRCGECKHRKKNGFCLEHKRYEKNDKGYCSYGERKSDE